MNAGTGLLGEADLHGLVDGRLEANRRADVLRKLAASPSDRLRVEAWQDQNDMIRAAFGDVAREALPVALDLAPPRLRCIDGNRDQPPIRIGDPMQDLPAARRRRTITAAATLLVVAVGMVGSWLAIAETGRKANERSVVASSPAPEAALAGRAIAALDAAGRTGATAGVMRRPPDLSSAGLRLAGVSAEPGEARSLIFRYRSVGDDRWVVLGLADAPDRENKEATPLGRTLAWRRNGTAYALAGTVTEERLRELARLLQDDPAQD